MELGAEQWVMQRAGLVLPAEVVAGLLLPLRTLPQPRPPSIRSNMCERASGPAMRVMMADRWSWGVALEAETRQMDRPRA